MTDKVKPLNTPATPQTEFELVPAGVYLARCYKMIDLGTQTSESPRYGTKHDRKIMLYWELLQDDDGNKVTMKDSDKPFVISNQYTWSMHKKANLRKTLDAWRGEPFTEEQANGFDISKLLGTYCKLQVVHNQSGDRTYANVGSIMSTNKREDGVNPLVTFSISDPDMEVFESLPDWLKDKIRSAPEWDEEAEDDAPAEASEPAKKDVQIEDVEVKDGKTVPAKPEGVSDEGVKKLQF